MRSIERHWQSVTPVSLLLYPLSLLYGAGACLRRAATRPARLPVPVIVIGNLTVGGTGKTPLVLWLAGLLREAGRRPGIVSRGYGGAAAGPARVEPGGDPRRFGDEPVLLAERSGCPAWVGADRVAAATALLAAHPGCDVIVSDDALQHYRLGRDVEICVIDGTRGLGNGWLLPAGPLREPLSRLASIDAVVLNGGGGTPDLEAAVASAPARFAMRVEGHSLHSLLDPARVAGVDSLRGRRVHAVAGIGNPERFFRHLQALGLEFTAHPFPDHHPFAAADLAFPGAEAIVMTEKDAVKCRPFANETHWALAVNAVPDPALGEWLLRKLESLRK